PVYLYVHSVVVVRGTWATVRHRPPALAAALDSPDALRPDHLADAELAGVGSDPLRDAVARRAVRDHDVQRPALAVLAGVAGTHTAVGVNLRELRADRAVHLDRVRRQPVLGAGAGRAGGRRDAVPGSTARAVAGVGAAVGAVGAVVVRPAIAGRLGVGLRLVGGQVLGVHPPVFTVVQDLRPLIVGAPTGLHLAALGEHRGQVGAIGRVGAGVKRRGHAPYLVVVGAKLRRRCLFQRGALVQLLPQLPAGCCPRGPPAAVAMRCHRSMVV